MILGKKQYVLVAAVPVAFGAGAILLGQDSNWDLLNYHYYNPYAFLNHRFDYDFAPAQLQTYYNPLLHIPFFWMVTYFPPRVTGFLLGALQGVNFCVLFGIARRLIRDRASDYKFPMACCLALVGVLGAGNLSQLGTAMGDNWVSLFILASLLLLLSRQQEMIAEPFATALTSAWIAGFIAGLGGGLKLTSLIFALGLAVGILTLTAELKRRILLASGFSVGVLSGVLGTSGFWFYELWARMGNPLFPYFNYIFHSPLAGSHSYRDFRFLPKGVGDAVLYPLASLFDYSKVAEVPFRDLRIPFVYLGLLFFIATVGGAWLRRWLGKKPSVADSTGNGGERLILGTAAVAYVAWLKLFGIYRYLVVLEMLAPIILWIVIMGAPCSVGTRFVVLSLACFVLLVTTRPANWGRRDWSERYFEVDIPVLPSPDRTLVVMGGHAPLGYLVPLFPQTVRFVRLESNFHGPTKGPGLLIERLRSVISKHPGPLYALYDLGEEARARRTAAYYGINIDDRDCSVLDRAAGSRGFSVTKFCQARKQPQPALSRAGCSSILIACN